MDIELFSTSSYYKNSAINFLKIEIIACISDYSFSLKF